MKKAITPVYQPIINSDNGLVLHYEALARTKSAGEHWQLIEMGESVGFIALIDIAMLEHVVDALRCNPFAVVAVNISGVTIDRSCSDLLSKIYQNMEFMRRVVFEITETSEISDDEMLEKFLMSVRLLGARVALDDYGAGFCTLGQVLKVKPNFVKLDGALVRDFESTGDDTVIREIVDLVQSYGGEIIAEHIDSPGKVEAMRNFGIRYLQGFFVGGIVDVLPKNDFCVIALNGAQSLLIAG